MHQEMNTIVRHLFSKESLEQVSTNEIEQLILKYPYFAPARYLLARKLYKEEDAPVEDKIVTAGLYIHNPLRLDWLLNHSGSEAQQLAPAVIADNAISGKYASRQEDHQQTSDLSDVSNPEPAFKEETSYPPIPESEVHPVDGNTPLPEASVATEAEADNTEPNKPADTVMESALVFQSYHTIDYFASQGIRLQQADLGKDKLGKQLKSFTEWLRSMKRLPPQSGNEATGPEEENNHQHVVMKAAYSLAEKEIITEAMAEVWAKQGNHQKARDIYHKLSLQNPGKSGYFATKIELLKA